MPLLSVSLEVIFTKTLIITGETLGKPPFSTLCYSCHFRRFNDYRKLTITPPVTRTFAILVFEK
jgi:hypothetical protein